MTYLLLIASTMYASAVLNRFMKIPKYADLPTDSVIENALKQIIECMNSDKSGIRNSV